MYEVNDNTRFSFGRKYKGLKMSDVPSDYLIWFYSEHKKKESLSYYISYIEKNLYKLHMREKWWNEMKLKH